jgi:hypothetical protein
MQTQQELLGLACAAWTCSEEDALQKMRDMAGSYPSSCPSSYPRKARQLVFDADFWPSLHVTIQTRLVTHTKKVPEQFYAHLAEALATLGSHDAAMMRVDFVRFPADAQDVTARLIDVGTDARLRWKFQGFDQQGLNVAPMQTDEGTIGVMALTWR